jgi:iron complex transport system substrate-binding protein
MKNARFAGAAALAVLVLAAPAAARHSAIPQRIVSLSPTATEDLFAVGAGKQVVAVDDQSNYPASAPKSKLSGYTPNAEAIATYKHDLVVASFVGNHIVEALGKLNPVLVDRRPHTRRRLRADRRDRQGRPATGRRRRQWSRG